MGVACHLCGVCVVTAAGQVGQPSAQSLLRIAGGLEG
jgi:hypothetical protein